MLRVDGFVTFFRIFRKKSINTDNTRPSPFENKKRKHWTRLVEIAASEPLTDHHFVGVVIEQRI